MTSRQIFVFALAVVVAGCSQQDKKPRLPENAVVGVWVSDSLVRVDTTHRYSLRITPRGMAEFTDSVISQSSAAPRVTVQRGTWDGADSLIRIVVRSEGSAARPNSLLFAIRRGNLGLVNFDSTEWGAEGLTLARQAQTAGATARP